MSLELTIQYKPSNIDDFDDINSESVKEMIREVRTTIAELKSMRRKPSYEQTLIDIFQGEISIRGKSPTKLDLTNARAIIDKYIQFSETGCDSCEGLAQRVHQEEVVFNYCRFQEAYSDVKGTNGKNSSAVRFGRSNPCRAYEPLKKYGTRFSKPLTELIQEMSENR